MPEPGFTGYSEWEGRPGSGMGAITKDEADSLFDTDTSIVSDAYIRTGNTFDQQVALKEKLDNKAKWEAMSIQARINILERQKAKARGGGLLPGDRYSLAGNISELGRLYSDKLTNQYQGKYGEEYFDKYGGWGSFNDLMAHGYLGSRVGLPMMQTWEAATQSQPSDFINNALASRFFRGNPATSSTLTGIPGLIAGQFKQAVPNAVRINNIMSKAGIQPGSASARWSHPMDAWGRLVHAEMSNPGSTGWNFQMNTEDSGVHAGGYLWDVFRGKTGAKLW